MNLVPDFFRILEIDRINLEQGEIAFPLLGTADYAFDGVASTQAEPANLRRRDVYIIGTGEIVGVGGAKKAEAILKHLDYTFACNLYVATRQLLENREHQFLLAHNRGVLDFVLLGERKQFGR